MVYGRPLMNDVKVSKELLAVARILADDLRIRVGDSVCLTRKFLNDNRSFMRSRNWIGEVLLIEERNGEPIATIRWNNGIKTTMAVKNLKVA